MHLVVLNMNSLVPTSLDYQCKVLSEITRRKHFRKNLIFEKKIRFLIKINPIFLANVTAAAGYPWASRIPLKNQPIWLSRYIYLHLLYREVKGILYFQLYFTGKLSCTLPRVPKTNFAHKTSKEQRRMLCRQNW